MPQGSISHTTGDRHRGGQEGHTLAVPAGDSKNWCRVAPWQICPVQIGYSCIRARYGTWRKRNGWLCGGVATHSSSAAFCTLVKLSGLAYLLPHCSWHGLLLRWPPPTAMRHLATTCSAIGLCSTWWVRVRLSAACHPGRPSPSSAEQPGSLFQPKLALCGLASAKKETFKTDSKVLHNKQGEKDIKCHSPCGYINFAVRS